MYNNIICIVTPSSLVGSDLIEFLSQLHPSFMLILHLDMYLNQLRKHIHLTRIHYIQIFVQHKSGSFQWADSEIDHCHRDYRISYMNTNPCNSNTIPWTVMRTRI